MVLTLARSSTSSDPVVILLRGRCTGYRPLAVPAAATAAAAALTTQVLTTVVVNVVNVTAVVVFVSTVTVPGR